MKTSEVDAAEAIDTADGENAAISEDDSDLTDVYSRCNRCFFGMRVAAAR